MREGTSIHGLSSQQRASVQVEVPVDHGLLMENLLDLAHAPFTHTGTFAKGWPVPNVVRFHTQRVLSGAWDPYPIDMSFEPPCMVVSLIGLKQPGQIEAGAKAGECDKHLHQLHVCLPSKTGHTRLLYRMSLDFMGWVKYVPGIQFFWQYIAGQVRAPSCLFLESACVAVVLLRRGSVLLSLCVLFAPVHMLVLLIPSGASSTATSGVGLLRTCSRLRCLKG